jgi:hypothetical protein
MQNSSRLQRVRPESLLSAFERLTLHRRLCKAAVLDIGHAKTTQIFCKSTGLYLHRIIEYFFEEPELR